MARPAKEGLDYFPLEVDMDSDDKIALVEAKHGLMGFGLIIKMFMRIYRQGYFTEWGEREQLIFSKRVNADIKFVNEVINDAVKWGLFHGKLLNEYGILTSRAIQKRFLAATHRRQRIEIEIEYLLLDSDTLNDCSNLVIVDKNGASAGDKGPSGTQSKVKESKEESKVQYREFVTMTPEELLKLQEKYGQQQTETMLDILDNYKGANGKRYKSDYRAVLSWVAKRYEEEKAKGAKRNGNGRGIHQPNSEEDMAGEFREFVNP